MQHESPKLSDLIRDWATAEGWPITVKPSVQFPPLQWVETEGLIILDENGTSAHAYLGTVHDDDAYFSPHSDVKENIIEPADPEFFNKLATIITNMFRQYGRTLDKKTLPEKWQWEDDDGIE